VAREVDMAKKGKPSPTLSVELGATEKAGFNKTTTKKITQVIPPDVTRRRNGAFLELISVATEWSGLGADILRGKRALLRIQQEETLYRVALDARERIRQLDASTQPIPTKALVPLLEKASLEHPDDDELIRRWANLLASAAGDYDIEVITFASILSEIGPRECLILQSMVGEKGPGKWGNRRQRMGFSASATLRGREDELRHFIGPAVRKKDISIFEKARSLLPADFPVMIMSVSENKPRAFLPVSRKLLENPFYEANQAGFLILMRQALIRGDWCEFSAVYGAENSVTFCSWYELTELGFAFARRVIQPVGPVGGVDINPVFDVAGESP
jgi:hypothetical protein